MGTENRISDLATSVASRGSSFPLRKEVGSLLPQKGEAGNLSAVLRSTRMMVSFLARTSSLPGGDDLDEDSCDLCHRSKRIDG